VKKEKWYRGEAGSYSMSKGAIRWVLNHGNQSVHKHSSLNY
jgi:hypothetical protein